MENRANTFIVGAMKSGTTSLFNLLKSHPQIAPCRIKEPHFFSQKDWRNELDWYHDLFDMAKPVRLEASTTYTCYPEFNPETVNDIFEYNPTAKIIYVVRNPVQRAISNYMHMYERGFVNDELIDAIKKETGIINRGRYYTQIQPYFELFGGNQIKIIGFESLFNSTIEVLKEVCDFLDIHELPGNSVQHIHSNKSVGGGKTHYKLDRLKRNYLMRVIKRISPKLHSFAIQKLSRFDDRTFAAKPASNKEFEDLIYKLLNEEMHAFSELTGYDIETWRRN